MKLSNPAPGRPVTSGYGVRRHPITGRTEKHRGVDYGGTFPVLSAGDGVVSATGSSMGPRGYGHWVRIQHGTRLFSFYAHGAHRTALRVGQRVRAGDLIFRSGTSGGASGPHLHFEVRTGVNGAQFTDVDPTPYLTKQGVPAKPLRVTGREDKATWREWQNQLKERWGYTGLVDGVPGQMTYAAIQRSVKQHGYSGSITGKLGPMTRRGVQQKLKNQGYYDGPVDGIWGRFTWSGIQRCLNDGRW
jgi:peptidoglycan hydrolase-like protein with peptidoglycan-binding domain